MMKAVRKRASDIITALGGAVCKPMAVRNSDRTTTMRVKLVTITRMEGASAKTEVVNCVNFNNSWHLTYNYADDVQPIVPAGTVLHNIQWHDNTTGNPRASDPRNWVGNGNRTVDEMGFFWLGWVELTDDEYRQALADRKSRKNLQTSQQQQ